MNGIVAKTCMTIALGHFTAQHGTGGTICIIDPNLLILTGSPPSSADLRLLDQLTIQHIIEAVILIFHMIERNIFSAHQVSQTGARNQGRWLSSDQ